MKQANLIAQLVEELNQLNPVESSFSALKATRLLKPVMTLAEILEYKDTIMLAYENGEQEVEEIERIVQRCLDLPAVPLEKHVPLGF